MSSELSPEDQVQNEKCLSASNCLKNFIYILGYVIQVFLIWTSPDIPQPTLGTVLSRTMKLTDNVPFASYLKPKVFKELPYILSYRYSFVCAGVWTGKGNKDHRFFTGNLWGAQLYITALPVVVHFFLYIFLDRRGRLPHKRR